MYVYDATCLLTTITESCRAGGRQTNKCKWVTSSLILLTVFNVCSSNLALGPKVDTNEFAL